MQMKKKIRRESRPSKAAVVYSCGFGRLSDSNREALRAVKVKGNR